MAKDSSAKSSKKEKAKTKKPNRVVKYFRDLKSELKKVVWPTRKTVVNNTGIVLVVMLVVGLFLAGVDTGVGFIIDKLIGLAG
ncbi:MAG: preprotein translocase subunit SecE [Oscillospiraceae bacterium]|nr:preprotein translocase subunit SecE [Oscillospiraceae bacterium]MBQ8377662.1 preprotein translocase subunit SecE [Oscillospiraceae bacterium]